MIEQHMPSDHILRAHGVRAGRTKAGHYVVDFLHDPNEQRLIVELTLDLALDMAIQTIANLLCQSTENATTYDSRVRKAMRRLGLNPSKPPS